MDQFAGNGFGILMQEGGASISSASVNPLVATKVDPNSLEQSPPTAQGSFYRLTLQNPGIAGTTMDQALTYTVPIVDLLGAPLTVGYEDLYRLLLVAGEAPPIDVRIWAGVSEGGISSLNRGCAVGLAYEAGNWRLYRAVNVGAGWGLGASATNTSASTRAALNSLQFSATTNSGTQSGKIMDVSIVPISGTNFSLTAALAINNPLFTHVFIGFDWLTGAGGSAGETIDLKGLSAGLNLTGIPAMS